MYVFELVLAWVLVLMLGGRGVQGGFSIRGVQGGPIWVPRRAEIGLFQFKTSSIIVRAFKAIYFRVLQSFI